MWLLLENLTQNWSICAAHPPLGVHEDQGGSQTWAPAPTAAQVCPFSSLGFHSCAGAWSRRKMFPVHREGLRAHGGAPEGPSPHLTCPCPTLSYTCTSTRSPGLQTRAWSLHPVSAVRPEQQAQPSSSFARFSLWSRGCKSVWPWAPTRVYL